ncbi:UDP-galactose 4-epimerase [Aspergillus ellipticus CBS 707.79]|uniref:UDP-galactose 4-epimerase n=1 Tax=Aspergillus ellipticus CBS 707.79 TaxID=1448320 RepID=A0A319DNN6_9EURO|nr:UDP-galactose 4-epimerase [Aspergillus ellipticus CBS 707.79]
MILQFPVRLAHINPLRPLFRKIPTQFHQFHRRNLSIPSRDITMKIAITGARGTVGRAVVKIASEAGHSTVQEATVKAFKGCDAVIHLAAIPDPVDKDDHLVHNNNVNSAFNGFLAAGELGIKRFCYASPVNAIGLEYATKPLEFEYFPEESETQVKTFVRWFPGMKIACMRIHAVASRAEAQQGHKENWDDSAVKSLWGWVSPEETARACLLAVEKSDSFQGCEIFNVVAPTTTQDTPSHDLAKKYYPKTEIRGDFSDNKSFFAAEKARKILGWVHKEE